MANQLTQTARGRAASGLGSVPAVSIVIAQLVSRRLVTASNGSLVHAVMEVLQLSGNQPRLPGRLQLLILDAGGNKGGEAEERPEERKPAHLPIALVAVTRP